MTIYEKVLNSNKHLEGTKIVNTNLEGRTFAIWNERALEFQNTELLNFLSFSNMWLRSLISPITNFQYFLFYP